jgi:RNA polymerase sigma-70 factor (ECF subfamily)
MKTDKEESFDQIYNNLKDKIYRLCLGYTGNPDDAKDLFQEIMILVWNNLQNFRSESNINTWVYRIASNRALLYLNKKNRQEMLNQNIDAVSIKTSTETSEIEEKHETEVKIKELYNAIATLKEIDRIVIGLLLEGCSYNEISDVTGLSTSNVGVRINRIKKTLTTKLSKS